MNGQRSRIVRAARRFRPIAVKEFRQIFRDWQTLAVLLLFPAFLMILFGYALSFDVKHIPLAVLDNDRTERSRNFAGSFLHSEYFDLRPAVPDERAIDKILDTGRAGVVLVIPPGFDRQLARGRAAVVQVDIDGSNSRSASIALGYVAAICQDFSQHIQTAALVRAGMHSVALPVDYRPRVWYNPELKSAKFLIPGIIVQILLIMTVISTALSIVREKERGTMEQLTVSPLRPLEVIFGKTVPYLALSLVGAGVVLFVGRALFGVAVKGNWILLFLSLLVFLVCGLAMGLLISTIANSQRAAYQLSALLTMLPSILLSGFIFPIRNMPIVIQIVSYIIPARYFLPVLRDIILKGVGLSVFWPQMLFLTVFAVVVLILSTFRLRRQMS